MTTDQETLQLIGVWLEDGRTALPDHVLDAVLEQLPSKPQRRPKWSARRIADMNALARYALAAAAVLVVAIVGFNLLRAPSTTQITGASPSANVSPSTSASPSPPAEVTPIPYASLPVRPLPGTRYSPAGEYGWEGGPGPESWGAGMHKVIEDGQEVRESTALLFKVGADCLAMREGQPSQPVRVGGFEGVSVEPYEPPVTFGGPDGDEITRAHALAVGDRTLCVFLTWHSDTTADELEAAAQALDTLRAVPIGNDRIRITFTLDEGWDIG